MSVIVPDCTSCKHLYDNGEIGYFCCEAFPDGIPEDYFWGKVDVRQQDECANKIRFEE